MGKRILVIENDPGIKEILNLILELEGFEVMDLKHAEFSVSRIVNFNPHLILMDILRPGNLERKFCQSLKLSAKTNHIPIILMSTLERLIIDFRMSGANDSILKPFMLDTFIETIKKHLKLAPKELFASE